MGVNLKDLTISHPISIKDLSGRILAVDSHNLLYQFVTTIRGSDGTPLQDRSGRITSHLQGIFSRTSHLLCAGIRFIFVFDGEPPSLKHAELLRRKELKHEAEALFHTAQEAGDTASMRKYAGRFVRLTPEMIDEAKTLVQALGQPVVAAPSEGEAQMAQLVRGKHAYAGISQDYDSLLYRANRLVRNLSIQGKHKLPGKPGWRTVDIELLDHAENLSHLGITDSQLLCLAILVGTDYNPGGIKGIGPKKALELVKAHQDPEHLFRTIGFDAKSPVPWKAVWETFTAMPVTTEHHLQWTGIDEAGLRQLLIKEHDFSHDRVEGAITNLLEHAPSNLQRSLGDF